jgi:hypothetical protein
MCEYCKKNKWKIEVGFEDGKTQKVCEPCFKLNFNTEDDVN